MSVKTNLGRVSVYPMGQWSDNVMYERLDIVTLDGGAYVAKTDHVGGADHKPGLDIKSWMQLTWPGIAGRGIENIELTEDHRIRILLTDGEEWLSHIILEGPKGETGKGISGTQITDDYKLKVFFTDDTTWTSEESLQGPQGIQGIPGEKGERGYTGQTGEPGRGITDAELTEDYKLKLTFTDETDWTGDKSLIGPKGPAGEDGIDIGTITVTVDAEPSESPTCEVTPEDVEGTRHFTLAFHGLKGPKGDAGLTFTPSVDPDGTLSWTNNGELPNPDPITAITTAEIDAMFQEV